jgi:lipopolysaccharide export system permease protein
MRALVDSLRRLQEEASVRIAGIMRADLDALFLGTRPSLVAAPSSGDPSFAALTRATVLKNVIEAEFTRSGYYARQIHEYSVEIYKKYSIPFACVVFVLIGAPLGIMARRGTFGVAASLSLGFFLLYWACLIGGEKLADRGLLQPWFGMWSANIIIGLLGLYLTFKMARESLTINWSALRRFFPKQWQAEEEQST